MAITTERADEKGSIAFALEVRATAQGSTEEEARANLKALLERYPDLLNDTRQAADRRVELIRLQGVEQLPSLPDDAVYWRERSCLVDVASRIDKPRMSKRPASRTLTMRTAVCALVMFALVISGCASTSTGRSPQQSAPRSASALQAVLVSTQLTAGRQRVAIGVLDQNAPVNDARVHARAYRGSPSDPLMSEADAPFKGEGLLGNGVYVAYLTFGPAGGWVLEISAARGRGPASITVLPVNVFTAGTVPSPGQPAPRSRNLTRADVPDLSYIDSGVPPNDMHEISIADAIAQRRPALIVFATPAFCTSAMCGPEVHAVQQLERAYRDRVSFIHVEIYQNFRADPSKMTFSPTVLEWRLQSEPWVFLVDASGVVRYAFEGPTATDELAAALDAMLGAR